jgi:pyruvate dehydrogenase E2 component (dihydrolipoamide acetyltransferase)
MVNIPGPQNDLSLLNLPVGPGLTIESIKKNVLEKSQQIRAHKDPHLGPLLKIVRFLPKWMLKRFLGLYSFLIYEFDTRLGIKFIPHKPFGAVIISNVGSLGIKKALLPLVPLARASMMISIGKASPEARVVDGEICIRDIVHLGITFDHRLFDGSHLRRCSRILRTFLLRKKT